VIKKNRTKGFVNLRPLVQDIDNGFVMDDFLMEKGVGVRI